jgi:hypothetical protein
MKNYCRKILKCVTLIALSFVFGCSQPAAPAPKSVIPEDAEGLDPTIGMLTEVFASGPIPVRGYGLVSGLNGTGSAECPEAVRSYLEKYILQHYAGTSVNVNQIIASPDTAVVIVDGIIPPAAAKGERFDVKVSALTGTQTTSLEGGWLLGSDLYEARQLGVSIKSLASAEGAVYTGSLEIDTDPRTGLVLGGGLTYEEYKINFALRRPDYRVASQIRNRINERYGFGTASALAPGSIELQVPSKYASEKAKFLQLVRATYLAETPGLVEKRILRHIQKLASEPNKNAEELALEAIGNASLSRVASLVNSSDNEVSFRAARCMSSLGDRKGTELLWDFARNKNSPYRIEAINAIVNSTGKQAAAQLRAFLNDADFSVRLAAYENLTRFNDFTISRRQIGGSFYLDEITTTGKPAIFVSRQEQAKIVLFAAPINCRSGLFVETPDGTITINAPAGEQEATIIRKHPRRPEIILRLKSTLDLADIIRTLCSEPVSKTGEVGPGLGVPYSTVIPILKQMVDSGAVEAEFRLGPYSRGLPIIKK